MRIVIYTPRLEGKTATGLDLPAFVQATPEERVALLNQAAQLFASVLRDGLGLAAQFNPLLRVLAHDGLYVAVEGDDQIAVEGNRVAPPKGVMLCKECHQPVGQNPGDNFQIFARCPDCAKKDVPAGPAGSLIVH